MPGHDLWPPFQPPEAVNSPIFLLKEQAALLQQKTKNLVVAGLRPASTPDGNFWVGFDLSAPTLGTYSYRLFEVTYPPVFYPLTLTAEGQNYVAQNSGEFLSHLTTVLQSLHTKQIVEAIMAQATALGPAEAGK